MTKPTLLSLALAAALSGATYALHAQEAAPGATAEKTYTAADFQRFAPKTAYDMLTQVPGFTIRTPSDDRGLGQASENVLVNGQRIANKSGGAVVQLQNTPASSVVRIEIREAATLDIPGLSGQVANVVTAATARGTGRYEWTPELRRYYAHPNLARGSVSYAWNRGGVDYTLSLVNQSGRGAYGQGRHWLTDATGARIETRSQIVSADSEMPTFKFGLSAGEDGGRSGHLVVAYGPYRARTKVTDHRVRSDGDDRDRLSTQYTLGTLFDANADYGFGLGAGRLKLILVAHRDHEPIDNRQRTLYLDGSQDGSRFFRDSHISETVFRTEYGWKAWGAAWQWSLERADNKLDQRGSLSMLLPDSSYQPVPYPEGSGVVYERRHESVLGASRALGSHLDLQVSAGAEASTLERLDVPGSARHFLRPKGSAALAWHPGTGWDGSLKLSRRVGQISFYDFMSQPNFTDERENQGNPDLVPPQSWELEGELGRSLGAWGKARVRMFYHRIEDIVDIIPIGETGSGVGNIPRATRYGLESKTTLQFDPIGWAGAKLDITGFWEKTALRDPLDGRTRPISGDQYASLLLALRHDVRSTQWAWGANANYSRSRPTWYLTEIDNQWEGPWWLSLFVENKDIAGATVRLTLGNLLGARHHFDRTVYTGRRTTAPIAFSEHQDARIGPIFSLKVSGTF